MNKDVESVTKQAVINGYYNTVFEGINFSLSLNVHENQELISALSAAKIPYSVDQEPTPGPLKPEHKRLHKLVSKFKAHQNRLKSPVLGPYTLPELFRKRKLNGISRLSFTITNLFSFDPEEFDLFANLISQAQSLYKPDFAIIDKHGLQNLTIKHEQNIEEVIAEYENDLNRLQDLHQRYNRAFQNEKTSLLKRSGEQLHELKKNKESILKLKDAFTYHHGNADAPKPGLLSLNKQMKLSYEAWQTLMSDVQNQIENQNRILPEPYVQAEVQSLQEIENSLELIQLKIDAYWSKVEKEVEEQLKRINHINLFNPIFQELFSELSDILRSMTSKGIYAKYFECNARSSIKQLEYLDEVIFALTKEIEDLKRIPEYFKWKHFHDAQNPLAKHIFQTLQNYPSDQWLEIFEADYISTYCEHELLKTDKFTDSEYQELLEEARKLKNFIVENGDFKQADWGKCSQVIFRQSGFFQELEPEQFFNEELPLYVNQTIAETPLTNQIGVAKAIARVTLSISRQFKIYHLQKANVLCSDDGILPGLFIQEMKKFGIKEFALEHYGEERLVESLITTDKPQYLIIRDGMLLPGVTSRIFTQLITIKAFETAGYKVINIDTMKYKEDAFRIRAAITEEIKANYQSA